MRINRITIPALIGCTAAIGACGGGGDTTSTDPTPVAQASSSPPLPQGSEEVTLDPAEFTTKIDNPYLPLTVGSRWVYSERSTATPDARVVVEVLPETKMIANGIEAVVVRDTLSVNGVPGEITDDWYAQDADGNVWYLGEDTAEYKNGKVSSRAGSFEAGVGGAQGGIAMLGDPQVGDAYRQEYLKGEAEDRSAVLSLSEKAQTPSGYYPETLMTRDLVPLEPKVEELKFFVKGVGQVLAIHTSDGDERAELISYTPGS